MIEILCDGIVHYRRPNDDPDVDEARQLIESGAAPAYSLREVEDLQLYNECHLRNLTRYVIAAEVEQKHPITLS